MSNESKTHVIDGKTYVEVERKAEVGEKVIVIKNGTHIYNVGDIVTIEEVNESYTNQTRRGGHWGGWLYESEYRVLEPVDKAPQSTASKDDSLDIIANLVRRVHSLERRVDSLSTQLRDTQNNVERQGVEIANIEAATKAPQSGAKLLAEAFEALAKYERSVGR